MAERDREGDLTECEFQCIFHEGKLYGDCRVPWSEKCLLNVKYKERENDRESKE